MVELLHKTCPACGQTVFSVSKAEYDTGTNAHIVDICDGDSEHTKEVISDVKLHWLLTKILRETIRYKNLMTWDSPENPYGIDVEIIAAIRLVLQKAKDAEYGRSWAKHGEAGVFNNAIRKADRLEKLALVTMSGHELATRSIRIALVDALMDLANYCDMWVSYIARVRPADLDDWVCDVWSPTTGIHPKEVNDIIDRMGGK